MYKYFPSTQHLLHVVTIEIVCINMLVYIELLYQSNVVYTVQSMCEWEDMILCSSCRNVTWVMSMAGNRFMGMCSAPPLLLSSSLAWLAPGTSWLWLVWAASSLPSWETSTLSQSLDLLKLFFPISREGHPHRCGSHCCDWGQDAVKGLRNDFSISQAVKDNFHKLSNAVKMQLWMVKILWRLQSETTSY